MHVIRIECETTHRNKEEKQTHTNFFFFQFLRNLRVQTGKPQFKDLFAAFYSVCCKPRNAFIRFSHTWKVSQFILIHFSKYRDILGAISTRFWVADCIHQCDISNLLVFSFRRCKLIAICKLIRKSTSKDIDWNNNALGRVYLLNFGARK